MARIGWTLAGLLGGLGLAIALSTASEAFGLRPWAVWEAAIATAAGGVVGWKRGADGEWPWS